MTKPPIFGALLCFVTSPCVAQDRELMRIEKSIPPTFMPAGEVPAAYYKPPTTSEQNAIKKLAEEWVKFRATERKWKASGFKYVGIFTGRPADNLEPGRYSVYRMTFNKSPYVGKQIHMDLLFYAQESRLVWPSDQWSKFDPAPSQMMAVVRAKLKD